jgi:hypothetical protein
MFHPHDEMRNPDESFRWGARSETARNFCYAGDSNQTGVIIDVGLRRSM